MAAGFTVPESGPGVVVLDGSGKPVVVAEGDGLNDDPTPESSLYDVKADSGFPIDGAAMVRVLALACGTVLAAVLITRVATGFAASSKTGRKRRREALGLE